MDHREIKKQALASILKTTTLVGDFENPVPCPFTGKACKDLSPAEKEDYFSWTRKRGMFEVVPGLAIGGSDVSIHPGAERKFP